MVKMVKQTMYNLRRPKVSLRGANSKGPMPKQTTNPVVAPTTVAASVFKSLAISLIPGVNMLEARGDKTVVTQLDK